MIIKKDTANNLEFKFKVLTFQEQVKYKKYKISSSGFLPVLRSIAIMVLDNPDNLTGPDMTSILFVTAEYVLPMIKIALSDLDEHLVITKSTITVTRKHVIILDKCFQQLKLDENLYQDIFINLIYPKIQALLKKEFKVRGIPVLDKQRPLSSFNAYYTETSKGLNQSLNHSLLRWLSKVPKIK